MNRILIKLVLLFIIFNHGLNLHSFPDSGSLAPKNTPHDTLIRNINFLVIGDWGKGDNNQRKVAAAMAYKASLTPIDFIISVGDNFYPHGVRGINDKRWKNTFEAVYSDSSLRKNWYTAIGNHDYEGNVGAQLRYHKKNPRWKTSERYYSFTKGIPGSKDSVLFVFIDSNPFDKGIGRHHGGLWRQNKKKQLLWLDSVLEKSTVKWKVVIGHHPLYTTGFRRDKTKDIQAIFQPIFEKNKVDVYFSGHDP